MSHPIVFVKSCPICGDGLCRVRVSVVDQRIQGFVLCDECEAMWTDPSMLDRVLMAPEDCETFCPGTNVPIWDGNAHWASVGEVCLLGWFDQVQVSQSD